MFPDTEPIAQNAKKSSCEANVHTCGKKALSLSNAPGKCPLSPTLEPMLNKGVQNEALS